jgi:alkanesulfonate monooxygenase SsuD/methylene tetrahydromethanopterin reductase-like flavin-dependent oxidoreductase (luciferase family)
MTREEMAMARTEFGLLLPHGAASPQARDTYLENCWRNLQLAEGSFTSVWMSDHLQVGGQDVLECWTTLAYLAALHPDMYVGSVVLCQAFRNPGLVAKMGATFQYLTGGRMILGLGAGWKEDEFHSYNYEFPSPGTRVSELEEAVQIIKALWTQEEATFEGKHYQVRAARCEPRPNPVPPILIGGHQSRMMRITARFADWWDISGSATARTDYPALSAQMDSILDEVGRDRKSLQRSFSGPCAVASSEAEVKELAARIPEGKGIAGTPAQVVEQLGRYIDLGVTRFQLVFAGFPDTRHIELFMKEVVPQVRA